MEELGFERWGSLFARIGLGFVFLWAGVGKVFLGLVMPGLDQILFQLYLDVLTPEMFTLLLGILELIVGLMLVLGLFVKVFGWISAVLLVLFTAVMTFAGPGFTTMWMNLGLLGLALDLAARGSYFWSIDSKLRGVM